MRQHKICLDMILDIPEELPFERADICAIYANALDNAMEACDKLEEEKRKIILESRARKGMIALKLTNPCLPEKAHAQNMGKMIPKTSKKDKKNHGYGLKSIKEIVNRYGGELEINREKESFELFLYLPLNQNE